MKPEKKKPEADTVKTTIRIRRDVWAAAMHYTIDEHCSLQSLVEQALEKYLKRAEGRK
jgi:hypothetical protein